MFVHNRLGCDRIKGIDPVSNEIFENSSFLYGTNASFIEKLYERYLEDPSTLSQEWQQFFNELNDDKDQVLKEVHGPSWGRGD